MAYTWLLSRIMTLGCTGGLLILGFGVAVGEASEQEPYTTETSCHIDSLSDLEFLVHAVVPGKHQPHSACITDYMGMPLLACYLDDSVVIVRYYPHDQSPRKTWVTTTVAESSASDTVHALDLGVCEDRIAIAFLDDRLSYATTVNFAIAEVECPGDPAVFSISAEIKYPSGPADFSVSIVDTVARWGSRLTLNTEVNGGPVIAYATNALSAHRASITEVPERYIGYAHPNKGIPRSQEGWSLEVLDPVTTIPYDVLPSILTFSAPHSFAGFPPEDWSSLEKLYRFPVVAYFAGEEDGLVMICSPDDPLPAGLHRSGPSICEQGMGDSTAIALIDGVVSAVSVDSSSSELKYFRSNSTEDGTTWQVHSLGSAWEHTAWPTLLEYGGRPLVCYCNTNYQSGGFMHLLWARTSDPRSVDDWEIIDLAKVGGHAGPPAVAIIDGLPYVAFIPYYSDNSLYLATPVMKEKE